MGTTVAENEARAGNLNFHRARDQRFACEGRGSDARADVDGNAADIVAVELNFAGVHTCPYVDAQRL